MNPRLFAFAGGSTGSWRVRAMQAIRGEPLPRVERVRVVTGDDFEGATWVLRGVTSNERYVTAEEKRRLVESQPPLGRAEATRAALIPIRKGAAWWAMPQDERRRIFEERSAHVATGLRYLPAVARRLHHCRDLATSEPFDFLTWFEFAPENEQAFDALVAELRASEEWRHVEREVEIRLARDE